MERLDACYFCGTAEDAPLREVSISPRDRRGDPDATVRVTLCSSCEGKLERVLAGLFEHVESRDSGERTADAAGPDIESTDAEPADAEPVDRIDVSTEEAADDGGPQGRRRLFSEPDDLGAGTDATGDDRIGDDEADAEDAEILDDEPRVRARASTVDRDALDGVSVAEYNRVMRLLSNREFPMARPAFVDLAASAYDLGEDTVEQVLDVVIDQGGLVEREGELVKPGDGEAP